MFRIAAIRLSSLSASSWRSAQTSTAVAAFSKSPFPGAVSDSSSDESVPGSFYSSSLGVPFHIPHRDEEKDEIEYLKDDSVNVTSLMLAGMKPDLQKKFERQDIIKELQKVQQRMKQNETRKAIIDSTLVKGKKFERQDIIKELQKVQQRMNQYETRKAIIDSTLVKGKPVGPHVLDMIGLFSRMESLGAPYDPVQAANIVLSSLHDGFASFRMRFYMDGLKPSLNELHGMLVDAEKNMDIDKKKKVLNVNNGTGLKKEAKARSNISRKGKDVAKSENGSKSNVDADHDCLYCKANGHWKRDWILYCKANGYCSCLPSTWKT